MTEDGESRAIKQVCDWCRTQKVKCNPLEGSDVDAALHANLAHTCQRCFRRGESCTFTYTHKKPGRPSNVTARTARLSRSVSPDLQRRGLGQQQGPARINGASTGIDMNDLLTSNVLTSASTGQPGPSRLTDPNQNNTVIQDSNTRFVEQLLQGSAASPSGNFRADNIVSALRQSTPYFHFPPGHLANATLPLNVEEWASFSFRLPNDVEPNNSNPTDLSTGSVVFNSPSATTSTAQPPIRDDQSSITGNSPSEAAILASLKLTAEPGSFMPIEVVAPWSDICFFISLHMRHQHALVPIVHRPSFAQDLLYRRDQKDENFRGFLASIGDICQSPMSLVGTHHTRERLKRILFRAHRFSRACQLRNSHQPTLPLLASVILDLISTQATDDTTSTDLLAAEARRLVYTLRIHRAEPREGMTLIEKEICRRMYWEVIAIEKTLALNGAPLMLLEMEGEPPLPMAVDDEYISEEHNFPQPANKRSYLSGFIVIAKMFRILGRCLQRHRMFSQDPGIFDNPDTSLAWIEEALSELRELTEGVPIPTGNSEALSADAQADQQSWWGIQCANIHITALCVRFACIDFRSALMPSHDSPSQRQMMAKRAYDILSSIPIDCLASNGQSLRGKILTVVLSLLTLASDPNDMGAHVWDWWNLAVPENCQA
uniref:Zn(2)-C6 fungal-type domain-containing protein n=1 Tax=Kwoniella bestiolae CBS 10118 TaxID=1296100 RepID=A0A1B9FSP0_9TREE|nr:hypothetical protein I302_08564 [Kwoniella bestiolae CBS 10118]OCF21785.1 hypothetical protein I302_08564 [Kwoniella bestiolae CBS 10118]